MANSAAAASSPTDAHSDFPSLTPAYTFNFRIGGPASPVGGLTRGLPLTVVHLASGSVRTAPIAVGDEERCAKNDVDGSRRSTDRVKLDEKDVRLRLGLPRLDSTVRGQGIDFVRNDPDGGRMRLDAGLVVEDDEGNVSGQVNCAVVRSGL